MIKFFLFSLLWYLTGNPFIAIIVLLVILYFLDRRYIGFMPSVTKPFKTNRRLSALRQELRLNPHNRSGKLEAARILIEKKKYKEALTFLEDIRSVVDDSADVLFETGFCYLKLNQLEKGEALLIKALEINPKVKYGEAYFRLGEAFASVNEEKAISYLEQFRGVQSSSCEAYYRLGQIYQRLGRQENAKQSFKEAAIIYRGLPKYMRRKERRWAILAGMKS